MKKIKVRLTALLVTALIAIVAVSATACNKQLFDFNQKFTRAYVKIGDVWKDVEIESWTDFSDGDQIQITLKDKTVILTHSANCILYNGELPR